MSLRVGHRCQFCGAPAESAAAGAPCNGCRTEFASSVGRSKERWSGLRRRLRLGLYLFVFLVLLDLGAGIVYIVGTRDLMRDEATFRASSLPGTYRVIARVLLLSILLTGVWLDTLAWSLPRRPTTERPGWRRTLPTLVPGASLTIVCIMNPLLISWWQGGVVFLTIVGVVSVLTAASAAALARRVQEFDRFRAGCIDVRARARVGPVEVWCLWFLLVAAFWALAIYVHSIGPYRDEGFDMRTFRNVLFAGAVVWFVALGSAIRSLRRWSSG